MLAHDRHDVAELNRLAREWREEWGRLSDRRIVAGGSDWAIGDRLVCRRNDYALDVRNGTAGTVVRLDPAGEHLDLFTDHGAIVRLPVDYLTHARHGYALTGHVSQGESVDRTFVLASPERGGAEWAYVASSRQRHDLRVFVVHHEAEDVAHALARAWSRSQAKSLALDMVDPTDRSAAMDAVRGDLDSATPERLIARAAEAGAERKEVRARLRETGDARARHAEAIRALERAEEGVREAERRQGLFADRLASTPPWRRGDRARLRDDLARAARDVDRHGADRRTARTELARLGPVGAGEREVAQRLGAEAEEIDRRLAPWRAIGREDRSRAPGGRLRDAPSDGRDLGRGR